MYGPPALWSNEVWAEHEALTWGMLRFEILPAGRHLWASGVPGRQYLFNCHVSGWGKKFSDHFSFTFLRLMEGGGVGANYSSTNLDTYRVKQALNVHIVCDPEHPDYQKMKDAGVLSDEYSSEWPGAFEVEDSREGWADALVDLLDTACERDDVQHTNRVYDVTNVRREGARLKTFGGRASGPLPLAVMLRKVVGTLNSTHEVKGGVPDGIDAMEIDHAIAECVVSGGNRRSARMSIMRWDDPRIMDFIRCKDEGGFWTTNISVEVDVRFYGHLAQIAKGAPVRGERKRAYEVHQAVVAGMLKNGEPGYWNSTLSNQGEPNRVVCTNPCGEIALEEWENCNLGHVNLDSFAPTPGMNREDTYQRAKDLADAHALMTRFLIRATYGDVNDSKQAEKLARNRRIGVGHFGVQGFLVKCGVKYSDAPASGFGESVLEMCRDEVRREARDYAFELRIPEPVKVTTVAPTGTIAKMPGRTEGIHPIYARYFIRRIRFSTVDPEQREKIAEYRAQGYKVEDDVSAPNTVVVEFPTKETLVEEVEALGFPESIVESADEISLNSMLEFQAMYQKHYADNAVSFTVNFPAGSLTAEEAEKDIARWLPHLKGTTLMPDGSYVQAPYERITREEYDRQTVRLVADSIDESCASGACPIR